MDAVPAAQLDAEPGAEEVVDDDDASQLPAPLTVSFSVYRYGFRFMAEELAVLEDAFAASGGATPNTATLSRIATEMSASPARLVEPVHPVSHKQIKTWFENRRQKLRRQRDRAAGRGSAGRKRSRSEEAEDGADDDAEDTSVLAAAKALLEASGAAATPRADPEALTPVRGVPLVNSALAHEGDGVSVLMHAIRDEVERSTLSAHTKELLMLHLLHSASVLRMMGAPAASGAEAAPAAAATVEQVQ